MSHARAWTHEAPRWVRRGPFVLLASLLAVSYSGGTPGVGAADPAAYSRIEEDWELVIGEPDPDVHAPQVVNVFAPTNSTTGDYAIFEINHSTQPEYLEGGMQLQLWRDDNCVSLAGPADELLLSTPGETLRYTLMMAIHNGQLWCGVRNGSSTTWGEFGAASLNVTCPARLPNLSQYSPDLSTSKSRVAFAGHRVERFVLKRIRYYQNGELVRTDNTARQVHPAID